MRLLPHCLRYAPPWCLALLILGWSATAHAVIDTDPGDYVPLPAGTSLALFYQQHAQRDAQYAGARQVGQDFRLDTDISIARGVHYLQVGGLPAAVQVIVPYGRVALKAPLAMSSSGMGDPMVGGSIWPYVDMQQGRFFAIGGFVSMPLGQYDPAKAGVNVGANRWSALLHFAFSQRLAHSTWADTVIETAAYSNNDNYAGTHLEQRPTVNYQFHLRHDINDKLRLTTSLYYKTGGRQSADGVQLQGAVRTSQFMFGAGYMVVPGAQVQLQYGKDIHVSEGARESQRLQLRLLKVF